MMKKIFFAFFLFSLFLAPMYKAQAQNLSTTNTTTAVFDTTGFPQWAKDMRRWNIITFGLFPFSMFVVTFSMDMIRWNNANGMDFSDQGRRYAPWPMKSAGAFEMTNDEYLRTIMLALGVSAAVALVDLLIVNIKRNNERRRLESLPSGIFEIERRPYPEAEEPPGGNSE
ncbi:MAG: hypothetical protein FWD40_07135 [Treponema sp.]|nr:hypothetical protein [Treponema sp.]